MPPDLALFGKWSAALQVGMQSRTTGSFSGGEEQVWPAIRWLVDYFGSTRGEYGDVNT